MPLLSSQSSCEIRVVWTFVLPSIYLHVFSKLVQYLLKFSLVLKTTSDDGPDRLNVFTSFLLCKHLFFSWQTGFVLWNLKEETFFDTFLVLWFRRSSLKLCFNDTYGKKLHFTQFITGMTINIQY